MTAALDARVESPPAPTRRGRNGGSAAYLLIAPALVVILVIGLFPFIYTLVVSFQNITMITRDTSWVGFDNYGKLFTDARLWGALLNTFVITLIALPIELAFGLLLALHFLDDHPLKRLFIALLIIPTVISPIVAGSMWRLMFDQRYGPVNQIISWFLGEDVVILWTAQPLPAFVAIIVCDVWEWTPFMFLVLLAALAGVDRDQRDAAEIDGASRWQSFLNVSLPAIWPVMTVALIIRALDLFRLFDVVWQLTRGGPGTATETISIYMFVRGFQSFDTSYTAAMVFATLIIVSVIIVFALKRAAALR